MSLESEGVSFSLERVYGGKLVLYIHCCLYATNNDDDYSCKASLFECVLRRINMEVYE